jgi:TonB family protein
VTPSVTPRPTPSAAPSATPKRALKPSPTPSPKPSSKKALLAKASAAKKQTTDRAPERKKITVRPSEKNEAPPGESSSVSAAGTAASAAAVRAQVVTYARLLHDRFYAEWSQPTGLPAGARYTLSVKVRIERDGRISEFKLARSSGNVVVDESVEAAGKRVTQVEALPRELAASGHYDLNVNFELDAD